MQAATGFGLAALLSMLVLDVPSGSVMLLLLPAALTLAAAQIGAAMRLREQPRPVPVHRRAGMRRLPR